MKVVVFYGTAKGNDPWVPAGTNPIVVNICFDRRDPEEKQEVDKLKKKRRDLFWSLTGFFFIACRR